MRSPFLNYRFADIISSNAEDYFAELSYKDKRTLVIDLLDKNQLYVNFSEIEDQDHEVSEEDILVNKHFYSLRS